MICLKALALKVRQQFVFTFNDIMREEEEALCTSIIQIV